MKKILVSITVLLMVSTIASAQLEQAKAELHKINKVFDSSLFLGFNMTITYHSDTIYGLHAFESVSGTFVINEDKLHYSMGDNEYVQTDSFVFDIDHEQKVMIMTRDNHSANSRLFPTREFVDSILTWYDTAYVITMVDSADIRGMVFNARYDSILYQRFAIYYDTVLYHPIRYEMEFASEPGEEDAIFLASDTTEKTPVVMQPIRRMITVFFTDYFIPDDVSMFQNEEYVYFNRQTQRYRPSDKFRAYSFYTTNIESPDEGSEVSSPIEDNPD